MLRARYGADVGLVAGGTIRGDRTFGPGELTVQDLVTMFPFEETCTVLALSGAQLLAALENGFSRYPAMDGRFPQISGVRVSVDPSLPPGGRICSCI